MSTSVPFSLLWIDSVHNMKFLATSLALISAASMASANTPPFPKGRFQPWGYHDEDAADTLGYTETTWNQATNIEGSAAVEKKRFSELTSEQKAAANDLGIVDADDWDCWIHNYDSYAWNEMPESVRSGFMALNWTETTWNADPRESPSTYRKFWATLSGTEREGAYKVCSGPQLWEEESMDTWLIYIEPDRLEYPTKRYTLWSRLDSQTRNVATNLGYNEVTWNNYGSLPIENNHFTDMTETQKEQAKKLGFDQPTWDCWVNHYEGYWWDEIQYPTVDLQEKMRKLDYNQKNWDKGPSPSWTNRYWNGLGDEYKSEMEQLCYNKLLWDAEPMDQWSFYVSPDEMVEPAIRQTPWDSIGATSQGHAQVLGYDKATWNRPGTADVEDQSWFELTDEQRAAAVQLGFEQTTWDCYMNHFQDFWWEDLQQRPLNVATEYAVLGFNQKSWDTGAAPEASKGDWADLSNAQKLAMQKLCWTEQLWQETAELSNPANTGKDLPASGVRGGDSESKAGLAIGIVLIVLCVSLLAFVVVRRRRTRSAAAAAAPSIEEEGSFT